MSESKNSPVPSADELKKLLDNGHTVVLRMCGLGSYFGMSVKAGTEAHTVLNDAVDKCLGWDGIDPAPDADTDVRDFDDEMPGVVETDDFTPAKLIHRLVEKATTGRIV